LEKVFADRIHEVPLQNPKLQFSCDNSTIEPAASATAHRKIRQIHFRFPTSTGFGEGQAQVQADFSVERLENTDFIGSVNE
jgi:hypothetical protein